MTTRSPSPDLRPWCGLAAATIVAGLAFAGDARAQYVPGPYSNYNWNYYGPMNYRYGFERYGMGGGYVSPYDPMVQAQMNAQARMAQQQRANAWTQDAAAANLFNRQAMAQAQRSAQQRAVTPRYDVRKRTPKTGSKPGDAPRLLPRDQVLQKDGRVIWPAAAASDGESARSRAAVEAAIRTVVREYQADGKATVRSVAEAKNQLLAYGMPQLERLAGTDRAAEKKLLTFFRSLDRALDEMGGK